MLIKSTCGYTAYLLNRSMSIQALKTVPDILIIAACIAVVLITTEHAMKVANWKQQAAQWFILVLSGLFLVALFYRVGWL